VTEPSPAAPATHLTDPYRTSPVDQRYILTIARQPLQCCQSRRWRVRGHNAVIRPEAANQRSLSRGGVGSTGLRGLDAPGGTASQSSTTLAHGPINGADTLTIELIQPDNHPPVVRIV
jgi:hypothetical protein